MKLSKPQLAVVAIILNTIIWSAASPILKWSLGDAPPFTLAFFRFLLASLVLLPFVWNKLTVRFEDLHKIFILSLVGITLHISFFYLGLSLAPSINAPIIAASTPIFLIIMAVFFLKEKPKKKVIAGTLVSMIGVLLIIVRPLLDTNTVGSVLGNIYYLLATLAIVIYTILLKKYKLNYSYATLIFWMFLMGALAFFPLFLIELQSNSFSSIDGKAFIGILYGAVFSSTLAYLFYNYSARYISANEIGIFSYLEPLITALVAIPLLNEKITFSYLLGAAFVFLGIFIAESRLHFHPGHNLRPHHDEIPPIDKVPTKNSTL